MVTKDNFIKATCELNEFTNHVPAPYFRREFVSDGNPLKLTIAVCGFYELYFNGKKITRGWLSLFRLYAVRESESASSPI